MFLYSELRLQYYAQVPSLFLILFSHRSPHVLPIFVLLITIYSTFFPDVRSWVGATEKQPSENDGGAPDPHLWIDHYREMVMKVWGSMRSVEKGAHKLVNERG
jgi:hypothetical protein